MKKFIVRGLIVLVVLIILAVVGVALFLDSGIKKGVETFGPQVAKVDVKLDAVKLSLFSGSGSIKGLVVGNPPGYKTPHAISVGSASLSVSPGSIFSDKVVIKSVRVEAPEITFEGGLGGDNLHDILKNLNEASGSTGGKDASANSGASKKLQVDDFVITGAKLNVALKGTGFAAPITLPDIHFSNLGQGPEGITAAELSQKIISEISNLAAKYAANVAMDIGKGAVDAALKNAPDSVNKAAKGVTDLFKKKKD